LDVLNSRSLDVMEIDAASHTGVDNVRENIIENARFTPVKTKYKVFIIDEVHMLSLSAFNALLKILEEPPSHVIFILCTTEVHKLPATIVSRCQRFDLKKVSSENLLLLLSQITKTENKRIEQAVLKRIVVNSDGCVRDAESLLGKVLSLGDNITIEQAELVLPRSEISNVIELLEFISEKNSTAAVELINRLINEGVDLQVFTDSLTEFLRKMLLLKINLELSALGVELDDISQKAAEKLAAKFSYDELLEMINLFLAKAQELKTSFIEQFPLEIAVVQLIEDVNYQAKDIFSGDSDPASLKEKIKNKIDSLNPLKHKAEKEADQPAADAPAAAAKDKIAPEKALDFSAIKEKWSLILDKILAKHYSLSSVLRLSRPLKCRGSVLEIGVSSAFFKDRLEAVNNKKIVEEIIVEVLGADSVKVKGVVCEEMKKALAGESGSELASAEAPVNSGASAPSQKSGNVLADVASLF